jgi:peptide/nickel transport system substrate-binding protein
MASSFPSFLTTKKIPSRKTLRHILSGPLTGLKVLVYGLFVALCVLVFILLIKLNERILVTVPARGGNLTEGVIGAPHFINPLLATTDTDARLVTLVYGNLNSEMANYTVSPDGTVYTITLMPGIRFSDGTALTSDDVVFTVEKMQDANISSVSDYWQNIAVENPDDETVVFTLPAPDTSFLSHLLFPVMPKHIWANVSDQSFESAKQNLKAVGAGPFAVSDIDYSNGLPTTVVLSRNKYYFTQKPLLNTLTIASFANQSDLFNALQSGSVDFSYSLSPDLAAKVTQGTDLQTAQIATGSMVSIYRSPADTVLGNATAVATINNLIDKNAIIDTVLNGYGTPLGDLSHTAVNPTAVKKIPSISLAVENDPSLLLAAQTLAGQLQDVGISVSVKAFDPGTFQENVNAGNYSLFLGQNTDMDIPQEYSVVLPLYAENEPYIFNTNTHTTVPDTVESPTMEYSNVTDWYSHTDKLWKWLPFESLRASSQT